MRSPGMCPATKDEVTGASGVFCSVPDPPISVDPPRVHPTPFSIWRVPAEVSRQRVASFFPVASHSWMVGGKATTRGKDYYAGKQMASERQKRTYHRGNWLNFSCSCPTAYGPVDSPVIIRCAWRVFAPVRWQSRR